MPVTILPSIQREIIRYGVSIYLIFGLVGNLCNCVMFTRNSYRRSPSSIYLLSLSIFSIIYLIWTFAPLFYTLNYTDPQTQSIIYCKVRQYGSHTLSLHIRYAVVLACFDRFLVTRTNVRIRSLSTIKTARILTCIMCFVCLLIALHMPVEMTINTSRVCGMFGMYKLSYAIYQIIIFTLTPPILMILFSIFTIHDLQQRHNINQSHARKRDRHLAYMVIAEVAINIISSVPYAANLLYGALTYYVTNKSTERAEIEAFLTFITQFFIYFLGVVPFYLFILVSKPFRDEFMDFLINNWYKYILRQTRVVPTHELNVLATNNH